MTMSTIENGDCRQIGTVDSANSEISDLSRLDVFKQALLMTMLRQRDHPDLFAPGHNGE